MWKFIKIWIGGAAAIAVLIANILKFPSSMETIMQAVPDWVSEDWVRLTLGILSIVYLGFISWPWIKRNWQNQLPDSNEKEKQESSTNQNETLEFLVHSHILNISVKNLVNTTCGPTRQALYYSWNERDAYIFDQIEGFEIRMFEKDFDGDGIPELILKYHCGAHTTVMNIYKIHEYGSSPTLIPGARIGSDWPDIRWGDGKDGGTLVVAKHRNWEKVPTKDFVEDSYLIKNGVCQKIIN